MKVFVKTRRESDIAAVIALHSRTKPLRSGEDSHVVIADLAQDEIDTLRENRCFEVFDDIQFLPAIGPLMDMWWDRQGVNPLPALSPWASKTLKDVMDHNRASKVWDRAQGEGVTLAIVDTGIDGAMLEFMRRSPHSYAPSFSTPWDDAVGHGTMCAAIACGSVENKGRYNGVAPGATLLSARSTLKATDLYLIYQHLLREHRKGSFGGGLVVSNSYALYSCTAPAFSEGHPYLDLIRLCVRAGMVFVFAAGNNHDSGLCGFPAEDDRPNTIWAVNSIDEVITVGTVDWNESNQTPGREHSNSSRGPGQWSVRADKPDVVAPTYGEVAWRGGYRSMEWWGTSGACPQVAGLAALLLSLDSSLTPESLRETIRKTARALSAPATCVGAGIIDCQAAVGSLARS
ncbi:MAG TPA: S8 family serine peptidase [Thermoanaerobaculia bacterium]|nr:S8 family serine peptidase [Thermoanaerobaculia bacterium]